MQDVGVSVKDFEDVLDNYDARWKAYIEEFILGQLLKMNWMFFACQM
jgi:hypothetical protein